MNKITFLIVGLLIGSIASYLIIKLNAPPQANNSQKEKIDTDAKSAAWIDKNNVEIGLAAKQFAKYAERADNMYRGTMNTRYLNIPFDILETFIYKYREENGANGMRIYPMIYTDSAKIEKRNLLNILLLPVKCSDITWTNDKITELINTDTLMKSRIVSVSNIDNEIGQCPPPANSDCDTDGSLLLQYSANRYATRNNNNRLVWRVITDK